MQDIFNDAEKAALEQLTENLVLLSALKKIFLAGIYSNGTLSKEPIEGIEYLKNYAYSLSFDPRTGNEYARRNEDLGKALRACNEALRIVATSFQEIDKFKKIITIDVGKPAKHR